MKKIKLSLITFIVIFLIPKMTYSQSVCDSLSIVMQNAAMNGQVNIVNEIADTLVKICLREKGESSVEYANALGSYSITLLSQNKSDEAIEMLHNAENIYLNYIGEDHPEFGGILSNLFSAYHQKGDFNPALQYIERALKHAEKTIGKSGFIYPNRLVRKAQILLDMGQNENAVKCAQEAVDILNNNDDPDQYYKVLFIQNLGSLQMLAGYFNDAIGTLFIALNKAKSFFSENNILNATILTNIGLAYINFGKFIEAKKYLSEAIQLLENQKGLANHELRFKGVAYGALAKLDMNLGLYDQALNESKEALKIYENLYGKNHPDNVSLNGNIGVIYHAKGEIYKALPYLHKSLDMLNSNPTWMRTNYSLIYNTIATVYSDLGQYEQALELFEKGEAMLKEFDKGKSDHILLLNQGDLLYKLDKMAEAEKLYTDALNNISESIGENNIIFAKALNRLSMIYSGKKKFNKALNFIEKSLKIYEMSVGKGHPEYFNAFINKALILLEKKDYKNAKSTFLSALSSRPESIRDYHSSIYQIFNGLAEIENYEGNYLTALAYFKKAREIIFYQINNNFTVLSENGKLGFLEHHKQFFSDFHNFLITNKSKLPQADTLIYNDILAMKGSVLSSSKQVFESIKSSGDSVLLSNFNDWKSLRQLIAKQESLEMNDRQYDSKSLDSLIIISDYLEQKLTISSIAFRQALTPLSWSDIKKGLKSKEALVEFFTLDEKLKDKKLDSKYYAIVIRGDSDFPEVIPLFVENQVISLLNYDKSNIEDYLYFVYSDNDKKNALDLYHMVWQPVEARLNQIKKVYYSPAGLLHRIAFAAIEKKKGITLLDEFELNYINSGKDIIYRKNSSSVGINTALMIGGINYKTDSIKMVKYKISDPEHYSYSTTLDFDEGHLTENIESDSLVAQIDQSFRLERGNIAYLPGSLKEINNISDLLKKNTIHTKKWSGYQALEDNFKKCGVNYPSPHIIHLSTHGFFTKNKSINPLFDSYLAFAGVQDVFKGGKAITDFEDGFLNAYEVVDMNLANTRLLVLSACDTGLGDIKNGEGVYGLPRAFKLAGCDHIIMSLWKIPDQKTADFMGSFYQNWLSGMNITDAFLKTQREMKEKYQDSFYWAAFVLI